MTQDPSKSADDKNDVAAMAMSLRVIGMVKPRVRLGVLLFGVLLVEVLPLGLFSEESAIKCFTMEHHKGFFNFLKYF